ncbi:BolA family transcriptional regulator [Mangrovimicrobium sediminis]|uniref:BolA family transcriptional regulator n=1 Tax=Mangrovimicrobium sediminis TaxID=2562682 RepID=A0A4Z0LXV2_9GAMM|nr:BolA family protein [Haliea sp. SAOS-164]TGD72109.1 BolA family transcriptional regulator [Haliea sp. SAOS-164]
MDAATVKALLQAHLPECEFHVQGEGANYDIVAVGEVFEGLRPVKKQQLIYAALNEEIASGAIHAVNMRTYTPEQWKSVD